jgi:hypothetical protein
MSMQYQQDLGELNKELANLKKDYELLLDCNKEI